MFRRAMDYLGLGPDDAYDDYDASVARERPVRARQPLAARAPRGGGRAPQRLDDDYEDEYYEDEEDVVESRPPMVRDDSGVHVRPRAGSSPNVRPVAAARREPVSIKPSRYDDAKEIADRVKAGTPVLMNISAADEVIARRLIDFASGLIYGIEGSMEKVSPGVFLIKPPGVRVTLD